MTFRPDDEAGMAAAMVCLTQTVDLGTAQAASVSAAKTHGPSVFAAQVGSIVRKLT